MTRQLKDGTIVPDTEVIEEVVKEFENQEEGEQEYEEDEDLDGL